MPEPIPRNTTAPNAFGVTESPRSMPPLATSNKHAGMTKNNAPTCVTAAIASRLVQLAVLMPIVSGMGGNAGTQTMAVAVRALALNELISSNTRRMIFRELRIASVNGLALGSLLGVAVGLYYRYPDLGIVIALAMVINNVVAGLFGIAVPVLLDKLRVDPAVSSAVFVTMATDVMGFFSFLGLATLWGLSA